MKYSMKEIRASLTSEKKMADGIWTTIFLRPLSMPLTWVALRLKLSANGVSYISALFSIGGGILFAMTGFWFPLIGAILLNIFSILDCVDGNVARVTNTFGPWGGWADAVMGFVAYTSVFISSGVYVFLRTGWWPILVVAAVTSSANLLTRVAYQIYKVIEPGEAHGSVSFERMLAENVGITGFMMPLLIVCHFIGGMQWILWFNLLFYTGGCAVTIFKLSRKANGAAK